MAEHISHSRLRVCLGSRSVEHSKHLARHGIREVRREGHSTRSPVRAPQHRHRGRQRPRQLVDEGDPLEPEAAGIPGTRISGELAPAERLGC